MNRLPTEIRVTLPDWLPRRLSAAGPCATEAERMRLVIGLAREQVERGTGGPFAAAVFERAGGRLVSAGVNLVLPANNSALHAEVVALMLAEARVGSYTLHAPHLPEHELVTSCDPCAMCLGAALWSGVRRLVCGAGRADAERIGFEEGPVFPESYRYLEAHGVAVVRGVLADEARQVFDLYRERGGAVYNG